MPQYKQKSYLHYWFFSFYNSFLNLEESICIRLDIDALVDVWFHGMIDLALYGPCVERCCYWHSNNWLSYRTTCVMAFISANGSNRFKSKSLMPSYNLHQNTLIKTLSFQLTSHASWLKIVALIGAKQDPWYNDRSFVVAIQIL